VKVGCCLHFVFLVVSIILRKKISSTLTFDDLAGVVALGAMLATEHPSLNATLGATWASNTWHFAIALG